MRLSILPLFLSLALLAKGEPTKVIGYLPHYRAGAIDALPYELLTDVVYFSLAPGANGSIDSSKAKPEILKKLTTLTKPKGVKVHVCVGGWGKIGRVLKNGGGSGYPDCFRPQPDDLPQKRMSLMVRTSIGNTQRAKLRSRTSKNCSSS